MTCHSDPSKKCGDRLFLRSPRQTAQTIVSKVFIPLRGSTVPLREKTIPAIPANDGFPLEPPSEVEGGFAVTAPSAALQGADHRTPLCFSDRLRRMTPHELELLAEIGRLEKMGASWPILRRALEAFQNAVRARHTAANTDEDALP